MVQAKILSKDEGIEEVYKILREVFVNENKFDEEVLCDELNNQVYHVLVYEGNSDCPPIATGRLIIEGSIAQIKWVAVQDQYRRKRYGDMIVRMLVEKAKTSFCLDIVAVIPVHLIEMFKKIGFLHNQDVKIKSHNNIFEKSICMKYDFNHIKTCQNIQNIN